jgi:hypothetical protein
MDYKGCMTSTAIIEYAEERKLDLEGGYRVWGDLGYGLIELPATTDYPFQQISDAYDWARQHVHASHRAISGPGGKFDLAVK